LVVEKMPSKLCEKLDKLNLRLVTNTEVVEMEEFPCQGLMGQNLVLECLSVRCAWVPVAMSYHTRP
jgi:hypothetical protein